MAGFDVGVIVRARNVPAANAGAALALVCEAIRKGIGPDDQPRRWDLSVAAGHSSEAGKAGEFRINETMLKELRQELGLRP